MSDRLTSRPGPSLGAKAPETVLWRSPSITISRREALRLTAVAIAGAALGGCDDERVYEPAVAAAGQPSRYAAIDYATTLTFQGIGRGAIARVRNERPVKIEGHPAHPGSRGGSDPFMQAATLSLYDPFRLRAPTLRNRGASNWSAFEEEMGLARREADANRGRGLALLMAPSTSPTEARLLGEIRARWPEVRLHVWDPAPRAAAARAGAELAFSRPLEPLADLSQADVVVLLDADPLGAGPDQLRLARDWSTRRGTTRRSRLYVAEPTMTASGAVADRRIAVAPARIAVIAGALDAAIAGTPAVTASALSPAEAAFVERASADLGRAGPRGLVLAGPAQPPAVHAASFAMTQRLGGVGTVLRFVESPEILPVDPAASLVALNEAVEAGRIETLFVLGVNPAYDAPASPDLRRVRRSVCLVNALNETSADAAFVLPLAHPLESWGDARAVDGTVSLVQPTVRPLFEGRSTVEILALLLGRAPDGLAEVRRTFGAQTLSGPAAEAPSDVAPAMRAFDAVVPDNRLTPLAERAVPPPPDPETDSTGRFAAMLSAGVLAGSAFEFVEPGPAAPIAFPPDPAPPAAGELTLVFRPDPTVWAGEFAGNAWLQELPKPLSRLAWSNALLLSPATAAARELATGDTVVVEAGGRSATANVLLSPGEAEGCARLDLGYGRRDAGPVGSDLGADAASLRGFDTLWSRPARVGRIGETTLVRAQTHASQEGRRIVREIELAALVAGGALPASPLAGVASEFYATDFAARETVSWGMTIDLDRCIGCGACVTACQAENNVPVVGPAEVERGRSMHWIRVDRYVEGPEDDPSVSFQPVPCMQCENAPCEPVCPVGASVHDDEGLNDQVYNRCVGTRFCQANCPYQVRRFNFLDYPGIAATTYSEPDWYAALVNPEVTVRARGVMEKCTFCVQRLRGAGIEADRTGGPLAEPQTACQQACPSQAIGFGDLKRPGSPVAAAKAGPRNYGLLDELGTKPRTTYLARIADRAAKDGAS